MALYKSNVRSFIKGLSDFWLSYFKEIDQLEAFYKGSEILVGQSYLDMLGLLLNSSVQDTQLFNKEYFKLLQIKETDLLYKQGVSSDFSRFTFLLPDDVVYCRYLNNKILAPTAALDKDTDYFIDDVTRSLEFKSDPTNAYTEKVFGSLRSEFSVRSKVRNGATIEVWLDDNGINPPTVTRSQYRIHVEYDGPANTYTTPASSIVQALNLSVDTGGLVIAELSNDGLASPPGTVSYVALERAETNPLDGFASRTIDTSFDACVSLPTISDWLAEGVERGDTFRHIDAKNEVRVSLVRKDALYLTTDSDISFTANNRVNFAILRSPPDDTITGEAFSASGLALQNGIDGELFGATRVFSSPTANFSPVHVGDVLEYFGPLNTGHAVILNVLDPFTIELGVAALVDDTPVIWNLHTSIDPGNTNVDGVFTNNGDGTATFTAASAAFNQTALNTVLRLYRGGELENYAITSQVSATEITVTAASSVANGSGLTWAWARFRPAATTLGVAPPAGWVIEDSVEVLARRYLDNTAVIKGTDYTVDPDTDTITPLTVWRTALTNTVNYRYRLAIFETVAPIQDGVDGTVTAGLPNTFSSPTAAFASVHVGYVIRVSNSGFAGTTNNGEHVIAAVLSPTLVELTPAKTVPSTPDANNGSLGWGLLARGSTVVDNVIAPQTEISFWAPDVLVDRYHLYNTYGYLINRFERSSEDYRSIIRGIFQLFMLGPTLERFESAINVVAGLDVVRDNGEILIRYQNNASQSGVDGVLDFTAKTLYSATATFVPENNSDFVYIATGLNENRLFKVVNVIDANTVELDVAPTTDTAATWQLSVSDVHSVTTSRTTYEFPRQVRLRSNVTDPANFGLYIFQAFEVLTDVFTVTDYVEDVNWWEFVRIPEELMPTSEPERRQSTPALFENVLGPGDDGRVGDPGFVIGADSEGNIPPSVFIRGGVGDGDLFPDPQYPFSNEVWFGSPTGNFTNNDLGSLLTVSSGSYRILEIGTPTSVRLETFTNVLPLSSVNWSIYSSVLAMRHKMAFVVLDAYLKHHLFSVNFDSALLGLLASDILTDLQELVYVAKPAYTYVVISPSALFNEVINVGEITEIGVGLSLGGLVGEIIAANTNPLNVIGSSWLVGTWFRYLDTTSTFAAPAASIPTPLGAPPANYEHFVNKFVPDFAAFTSSSLPIQVSAPVFGVNTTFGVGLDLAVTGTEVVATFPGGTLQDTYIGATLRITGSGAGNDGDYTLGRIPSDTEAHFGAALVNETGLSWELLFKGSGRGTVSIASDGRTLFTDNSAIYQFDPTHAGNYVVFPYVNNLENQAFRIHEQVGTYSVEIADTHTVEPPTGTPYKVGAVDSVLDSLIVAPGEVIFTPDMCAHDREISDFSTHKAKRYYVTFTSGPNTGLTRLIHAFVSSEEVRFNVGVFTDPAADFKIDVVSAYDLVSETTDWLSVKEQIKIDETEIVFDTPVQDVDPAVSYTAYGVREPTDLSLAVFDETNGDTLYYLGMPDPKQRRGKSRTGITPDLREEPIQITRT